jgi:hypothetical protein
MNDILHIIRVPLEESITHYWLDPDAVFLSCQAKGDMPCLWFIVPKEPHKQAQRRTFVRYETGEPLYNKPGTFLGTCQVYEGLYVVHIFEEDKGNNE